jgi:predicted metal-dependent phosphoesterase TrpH
MPTIRLDLHIHTIYSEDALIKPENLIDILIKKRLDGCAICDHGTLKAYKILKDDAKQNNLILIPGMEIETNIGEVIGLFLDSSKSISFGHKENFFQVVSRIKKIGGLVIIPHPFDFLRRNRLKMQLLNKRIIEKYIDGIEVMNSRILFSKCINTAKRFQNQFKLIETGGSDAHTLNEIGKGYTIINTSNGRDLKDVKKALLLRRSSSTGSVSSPYVHLKTVLKKIIKRKYF